MLSQQQSPAESTSGTVVSGSVDRYAWVILLVVFLVSVAAPLNQFKVPPLLPMLMESLRMDLSQGGLLMSIFALTGLVLALPAGLIVQRFGPKATGLLAMACLVVGSGTGTLATSADLLLISRVLEGAGLVLIGVVGPMVIALWFPRERQGLPMGLWATWVPVGNIMMYYLAPALGISSGWRAVWWFGAGFALVAMILYALFMRLPPDQRTDSGLKKDVVAERNSQLIRATFSNRNLWLLTFSFSCFAMTVIGFSTYFPTFLNQVRNYSLVEAGSIAGLPNFTALVAAPLFGWLSDRTGSRRIFIAVPFLVLGAMMLFPFSVTGTALNVFMLMLGLIPTAIPAVMFATVPEVVGNPRLAGFGLAVLSLGTSLGTLIGPFVVGKLVEAVGWTAAGNWLIPICFLGFATAWMVKVR